MELELDKLSKEQLREQVNQLQSQLDNVSDLAKSDALMNELHVQQIQLEMQNRDLIESQRLLEETRDKYADLYDFAPVNYITFDNKGIIKNINFTGTAMFGKVRTNLIDRPFTKWVVKEDINKFINHVRTTLQSKNITKEEIKIKLDSGEELDVRLESIRSNDVLTGSVMCRSVILDFTKYNKIKNEIYFQARQLKLITDSLPVLIAYIDKNERHQFVNKTYADSFGFLPQEIVNKTSNDIWGDNIYQNVTKFFKMSLSGQQVKFDMELPLGDRNKKYFNATFIPDFDNYNNKIHGVFVLIGDITDRLAIEAIDRKRLLDIAHFSRLSTMGEMATEIAHELNQPLAAISIYSDACRRIIQSGKADNDQIIQSLNDISTQAERASDVIRRIRDFASKKEIQKDKININFLVEEALQLLEVEIRARNINLELNLNEGLPDILADKILIEQVVFNLARNALDAMEEIEESQRLLKIETLCNKPDGIEVKVIDSGPGLSDKQIKTIFEPFHTTKSDGMGMGLTISHSIIEAHHGRLWAVSNVGAGTTFVFTIPFINEEVDYAT